jgi:hypothetical protein
VRLTVPRRGGWRAWGTVRPDFERALADPGDPVIASAEIASEIRRVPALALDAVNCAVLYVSAAA